ncbi:MAG: hypothetical protein MK110_15485 [Fuerstiella sp.]|nr:hypothetical protein [Fuerstiella sp.]
MGQEDMYRHLRRKMVDEQIAVRGSNEQPVMDVLRRVPGHRFVPDHIQHLVYRVFASANRSRTYNDHSR